MIKIINEVFKNKSLLGNYWHINDFDERLVLSFSQKNKIPPLLAKLLLLRGVNENFIDGLSDLILNKEDYKLTDSLYPPKNRCPSNFTKCPCLN